MVQQEIVAKDTLPPVMMEAGAIDIHLSEVIMQHTTPVEISIKTSSFMPYNSPQPPQILSS